VNVSEDIRHRLIDGCSQIIDNDQNIEVDTGYMIENLLLFDRYVLSSIRLKELPALVKLFGIKGLDHLFNIEAIKIFCEALTIGQIGQTSVLESRRKKGILPLGCYSFTSVEISNKEKYINNCLKVVENISFLNKKEKIKLKSIVFKNLLNYPKEAGKEIIKQLKSDMINNEFSIKIAISNLLEIIKGIKVSPDKFDINIIQLDEDDFKVESNLQNIVLTDITDFHKIVERALLTIGGRNQRIYNMNNFNALTSFRENEIPLFSTKLDFLSQKLNPDVYKESLRKVLEIKGIPTLGKNFSEKIDVKKFLKIRESKECQEFRSWLWSIHEASESELNDYINSYKQKIGEFFKSPLGKTIRLITGVGLGLVPSAGVLLSGTYGILDLFLLKKILPVEGAIVFINKKLPSIFH